MLSAGLERDLGLWLVCFSTSLRVEMCAVCRSRARSRIVVDFVSLLV